MMNRVTEVLRDLAARWDDDDDRDAPVLGRRLRAALAELEQSSACQGKARQRDRRNKQCPQCGSDIIEGHGFDDTGGDVRREVECLDCGSHWTEVFVLTEYINLTERKLNHEPTPSNSRPWSILPGVGRRLRAVA
jgi:hypothetical protein